MKIWSAIALFLWLTAHVAAQDVVKVDPQHYKVVFENSHLRVIEGRDQPGDKTPMHHHPAYLSYLEGPVKAKITLEDGKVIVFGPGNDTWCGPPTTHSTENIGTTNTHEVVVEFKDFDPCNDNPAGYSATVESKAASNAESRKLVALTNDWTEAINRKDRSKLEELMAPDYALYKWDGELRTPRAEWLDNLINHVTIKHYEHKDIGTHIYGNLANVTSIGYWSGSFDREVFNEIDVVVDTWRRTNGKWQVIARTSHPEPVEDSRSSAKQ
jgi:beta-alanine degradation protein BauB